MDRDLGSKPTWEREVSNRTCQMFNVGLGGPNVLPELKVYGSVMK